MQQEPVCKVALFCKNAAETNVLPYYRQMFDDKLQVALSGADWVDLMRLGLSKGVARGALCAIICTSHPRSAWRSAII